MRDLIRRTFAFTRGRSPLPHPVLSFGSWDALEGRVLAVCHPDWRGVRAAAHAFGDPVAEVRDAAAAAEEIVTEALDKAIEVLVIHGFPPGSDRLLEVAKSRGLSTRAVVHASMAQHGAEKGEAAVMSTLVRLGHNGTIERIGFVKEGHAEAFGALGVEATFTPNRAPRLEALEPERFGSAAMQVGVFAEPFWRKNVVTQLGAVALLGGTAHVMRRPDVAYLDSLDMVEHGDLPRDRFLRLQAGMDLNLYVTLSECHPMGPIESYLSDAPALMSRTSGVFRDDEELWRLTTVDVADDPGAIAAASRTLLEHREEAIDRAKRWIARADADAAGRWDEFVRSP